jgi:3-hydroxybutyryl-CoA dehydratase
MHPDSMRERSARGLQVGDDFVVTRSFSRADVDAFAALSRDYHPVHFDPRYARVRRFEDTICHGLLSASLITEIGGQIGWLASRMDFRFLRPVYVGDTLTCHLSITAVDERLRAHASTRIVNQEGIAVIEGELEGVLPGAPERAVLRTMLDEGDPSNPLAGC